jgi:hypothetical protein
LDNAETAKALIAGYTAWSREEYLDWGLRKADTELRARPETLRVLLIIHDGERVPRGMYMTCSKTNEPKE